MTVSNLLNSGKSMLAKTSGNVSAQSATTSASMLFSAWSDYKKVQQVESTKREQIKADKEVAIFAIKEQASILRDYLDKVFSEREKVIDRNFSLLNQALESDNLEMANMAMNSITQLVTSSPLAQAKELFASIHNKQVEHIEL